MCYYVIVLALPTTFIFFFFNDTATTEIYTLSLHDALPISLSLRNRRWVNSTPCTRSTYETLSAVSKSPASLPSVRDRKSTRLNSSHSQISYAVFCLKKKKKKEHTHCDTQAVRI